jgi:dolichol-phosphate mannosyltransferase
MAGQGRLEVSVLIPSWNEKANLEKLLPAIRRQLVGLGVGFEIIVVDAGSDDGTQETARKAGARVVLQTERGYGGALMAGFAEAAAPFVVTMDADLSHPPEFLQTFWERRNNAEMLIASRYVRGGRAEMSRFRRVLSLILNQVYARVLAVPLADLSSGFRMYRRDVLQRLNLRSRDFDVLEEILIRIYNEGWRVLEVPFHYLPRGEGRSHARLFKFGIAYAKTLFRMACLRYGDRVLGRSVSGSV